jgi:hypothetical protein
MQIETAFWALPIGVLAVFVVKIYHQYGSQKGQVAIVLHGVEVVSKTSALRRAAISRYQKAAKVMMLGYLQPHEILRSAEEITRQDRSEGEHTCSMMSSVSNHQGHTTRLGTLLRRLSTPGPPITFSARLVFFSSANHSCIASLLT